MFESKNKKIIYTPVNPSFTIIKVGCKGMYITRTCLHDESFLVHVNMSRIIRNLLFEYAKTKAQIYQLRS